MSNYSGTWSKLKDGTWGVRGPAGVVEGDLISVVKKSGEAQDKIVTRVLWAGTARDGTTATLLVVGPVAKASGSGSRESASGYYRRNGIRRGVSCGYPGCTGDNFCDECSE